MDWLVEPRLVPLGSFIPAPTHRGVLRGAVGAGRRRCALAPCPGRQSGRWAVAAGDDTPFFAQVYYHNAGGECSWL